MSPICIGLGAPNPRRGGVFAPTGVLAPRGVPFPGVPGAGRGGMVPVRIWNLFSVNSELEFVNSGPPQRLRRNLVHTYDDESLFRPHIVELFS